jgi:arylsulfatase A-like enzyme
MSLVLVMMLASSHTVRAQAGRDSLTSPDTARPNVVVIVVDDLRFDEFSAGGHPYLETPNIDRLAAEGALFTNAFHAVPLCSPNRASLLTGQYPSRHGIIDNVARNRASHRLQTFPRAMQDAGYATAFIGKWHMGNDPTPRPGFDYWSALPGQGRTIDPDFYEDGRLHRVDGYVTDLLTDRAVDFIGRDRDGPFMLYLAHKAVHPDVRRTRPFLENIRPPRDTRVCTRSGCIPGNPTSSCPPMTSMTSRPCNDPCAIATGRRVSRSFHSFSTPERRKRRFGGARRWFFPSMRASAG